MEQINPEKIYDAVSAFTGWLWGIPILIVLIGGGVVITFLIGGVQFTRFGFIMKHTLLSLFDKEEQARKRALGVSPAQAVTAALGTTIGTGNIVGVASAISLGGPGALFWMWGCGFVAMAIKFGEVTLSCNYRQRNPKGSGYLSGPFMYIRDGLHSGLLAYIVGFCMLVAVILIAAVHSSTITNTLDTVSVPPIGTCVVLVVVTALILVGGFRRLVQVTDRMVPFMTLFYLICSLIVIGANIGNAGSVISSIFKGAFAGHAAIGGFAGSALSATVRWGLARGVFSNDAGLGLQAILHSQAEGIDHPAQQGMWAVFETFIDTIVVCSLTGFMVLFSGVWQTGGGALLASDALISELGSVGRWGSIVAVVLFALSSIIGIGETVKIQSLEIFGSKIVSWISQAVFVAVIAAGCIAHIQSAFVFADLGIGIILTLNVLSIILLGKTLRALTREWFDSDGLARKHV